MDGAYELINRIEKEFGSDVQFKESVSLYADDLEVGNGDTYFVGLKEVRNHIRRAQEQSGCSVKTDGERVEIRHEVGNGLYYVARYRAMW